MSSAQVLYLSDKARYHKNRFLFLREAGLRFMWILRRCENSKNPIWHVLLHRMKTKYGLEIGPSVEIGPGLYIGHPFNITINPEAIIGRNVNIHRGCVIGQENRGDRAGAPTIGNEVWIGINAVIVGKISIGSDVLIAPNSYVNQSVPDHSIVFGNPCRVISRNNATFGYIKQKI